MGDDLHRERLRQADDSIRRAELPAARDILRELVAGTADSDVRRLAAIRIVEQFFLEQFRPAVAVLAGCIRGAQPDPEALKHYAFACFSLQDYPESIRAGHEALRHLPQDWAVMKTLGMALLVAGRPVDAYLAFSAGMLAQPKAKLEGFRNLAARLMQGQTVANFTVDGQEFRFNLRVDNGQMLEAALYHLHGGFTEMQELRLVRDWVRSSATLVEVGTLVGNHLVYFLKTLKPKKAIVFDISALSIAACRDNVRLNEPYAPAPELVFRPTGISGSSGTAPGPDGRPAPVASLDEAVAESVDFIKIDVDGLEIEALRGARGLMTKYRPKMMIEIARENDAAFHAFLRTADYRAIANVEHALFRNYLIEAR